MLTWGFVVHGDGDLDAQTDIIMDELLEVEEQTHVVFDSSVSAAIAERRVEISFAVDTDDPKDAQVIAAGILDQVIRAAGGNPKITTAEDAGDVFQWDHSEQRSLVDA